MDMSDVKIYGFKNAEVVLPNEPLFTIEGTLDKVQLIETTFLNLTNYPTLISSLAMKLRLNTNYKNKIFIEDGSKYAQSPNGSVIGVKYAYIGGVDKTTNLLASKYFNLPLFVNTPILEEDESVNFEDELELNGKNLISELSSIFSEIEINKIKIEISKILYTAIITFKSGVFTYEIKNKENLSNEIHKFKIVAFLLNKNKGDSNHQSILILNYEKSYEDIELVNQKLNLNISDGETSDGLDNKHLLLIRYNPIFLKDNFSLKSELFDGMILGSEFLVSFTKPALGMVYKINQVNGKPCMKFSEDKEKQTIPGFKTIIRMFDNEGHSIGDFMCLKEEAEKYINSTNFDA
jgi:nicotinate phosphoribosyltransferase